MSEFQVGDTVVCKPIPRFEALGGSTGVIHDTYTVYSVRFNGGREILFLSEELKKVEGKEMES